MHSRTTSFSSNPSYTVDESQNPDQRRSLIESCTKEWQNNPELYNDQFTSDSDWFDPVLFKYRQLWAVAKAPKVQRLLLVALFTLLVVLYWRNYASTYFAESKAAWESMNAENKVNEGNGFGPNKRVHSPGMIHIKSMNSAYLPRSSRASSERARKNRRLIFIGDIHGCIDELRVLIQKVKYNPHQDHLIALGDVVNKGPDSKGVVDFLMERGASCVRGNHDDRILLAANELSEPSLIIPSEEQDGLGSFKESKISRKVREDRELAKSLSKKQLEWLRACPVILRVGDLSHFGELVAVHAGLVPGIPLEDHDPVAVMNMRIVDITTHTPSKKHSQEGSVPWAECWNQYQKQMSPHWTLFSRKKVKHTTVVYGHDSKRGLQLDTYTKGLDTGCVNGNKLTAWVVSDFGREEIVQVKCKEQWKHEMVK